MLRLYSFSSIMQYRELWGFYLLGFPSVVREFGVFYVVVYRDSPVWSGFDFFFESFVRFVVSFMNGLNGDSCGGRCPPCPDGWLARGWSIVELAVGSSSRFWVALWALLRVMNAPMRGGLSP